MGNTFEKLSLDTLRNISYSSLKNADPLSYDFCSSFHNGYCLESNDGQETCDLCADQLYKECDLCKEDSLSNQLNAEIKKKEED